MHQGTHVLPNKVPDNVGGPNCFYSVGAQYHYFRPNRSSHASLEKHYFSEIKFGTWQKQLWKSVSFAFIDRASAPEACSAQREEKPKRKKCFFMKVAFSTVHF